MWHESGKSFYTVRPSQERGGQPQLQQQQQHVFTEPVLYLVRTVKACRRRRFSGTYKWQSTLFGGGTTCLELAFMTDGIAGFPSLILVRIAV